MWRVVVLLGLGGCPWVGGGRYDQLRDLDQDGENSVRFGGGDCQDDNADIVDCDADDDGQLSIAAGGDDCDDTRADVYLGAVEICDGQDNDCDGAVDNDDPDVVAESSFFLDRDGDGAGDPSSPIACQEYLDPDVPSTRIHSSEGTDCDDMDASVNPSVDELCDGFDNNCDGVTDDAGLWFLDDDRDGFGRDGTQAAGPCDLVGDEGLASRGGDCDDDESGVFPGAAETAYDGIDQNCNGGLDDWDVDFDRHVPVEHWSAAQAANALLPQAEQWPIVVGDCDDTNPARFDGNPEFCDGFDNDCDLAVDAEDLLGALPGEESLLRSGVTSWFIDVDGDGHFGTEVALCPLEVDPALHAATSDDCFDGGEPPAGFESVNPASVFVGAAELCDGFDNNCDTRSDWDFDVFEGATVYFFDGDGDAFGDAPVFACGAQPANNIVAFGEDCNDGDATVWPGALEVCGDSVRQDCSAASVWDCDGDGQDGVYLGSPNGEDCNDINAAVFLNPAPGGEVCDGIDNDCDGLVDSEDLDNLATELPVWYPDLDADGWGDSQVGGIQQCDMPGQASVRPGDCDDADPARHPESVWYEDLDGDGFGTPTTTVVSCTRPAGSWALEGGDCNDNDAAFHPQTRWLPDLDGDFAGDPTGVDVFCTPTDGGSWVLESAGIDCDDTDPLVQFEALWYRDQDGDGFGSEQTTSSCSQPVGYVPITGDCEDHDPTRNPVRDEICNGVDDDCDGDIDDADSNVLAPAGLLGFQDLDGDGVGSSIQKNFCYSIEPGWSDQSGDCDDTEASVHPGATELCGNGIDEDCDGSETPPTWYADLDADGFGAGAAITTACDAPDAHSATRDGDCDDHNSSAFPGAPELDSCDAVDSDCDGTPEPRLTWYQDLDGDGYGDDAQAITTCTPPAGTWVLTGGDCADDDPNTTFGRIWYLDNDGDELGNPNSSQFLCPQFDDQGVERLVWLRVDVDEDGVFDTDDGDEQLVVFGEDCDDNDSTIGASLSYFVDADGDGWGDALEPIQIACPTGGAPAGLALRSGDCVDRADQVPMGSSATPAHIHPGQVEVLGDLADNDCDGFVDDGGGAIQWYSDVDGDGLGFTLLDGYQPGAVTNAVDCDDNDPAVQNGLFVYLDDDGDGRGAGDPVFVAGCEVPDGFADRGGDCDDRNAAVKPELVETCDAIDNNCNGMVDENLGPVGYIDADGDGSGDPNQPHINCGGLFPLVSSSDDCDDQNPLVNPSATEACDGVDTDCIPGLLPGEVDLDGDGVMACEDDCDDTYALQHPGMVELCDGVLDNDCGMDGTALAEVEHDFDEDGYTECQGDLNDADSDIHPGDASVRTWYADNDGDGFGDDGVFMLTANPPGGWVLTGGDCNDALATANPAIPIELCDGVDNNCDGALLVSGAFSSPDAPNPDSGVFVVGEVEYLLDKDGNNAVSLLNRIDLCNNAPVIGVVQVPGQPGRTVVRVDDNLTVPGGINDCDDGSGTTGVVWAPDHDGDGAPAFNGPEDLFLACGGASSPAGYVVVTGGAQDCAPFDGSRSVLALGGAYVDADGDGAAGLFPISGEACVGMVLASGTDCNDADFQMDPRVSTQPIYVNNAGDLDLLFGACDVAVFDLDLNDLGSAPFRPNVDYLFRGVNGTTNCNETDDSGCLGSLGPPRRIRGNSTLRFENIGIRFAIDDGAQQPNAAWEFDNVFVRTNSWKFNSRVSARNTTFYNPGFNTDSFIQSSWSVFLDNVVLTGILGQPGVEILSGSDGDLRNTAFNDLGVGLFINTNKVVLGDGLAFNNSTVGVKVVNSELQLTDPSFDGNNSTDLQSSGLSSVQIDDGVFRFSSTAIEALGSSLVDCQRCDFSNVSTASISALDSSTIRVDSSSFFSMGGVAGEVRNGAALEVVDSLIGGGQQAFNILGDGLLECTGCDFDTTAIAPLISVNMGGFPEVRIVDAYIGGTTGGVFMYSNTSSLLAKIEDSTTSSTQTRGLFLGDGNLTIRDVVASSVSATGDAFVQIQGQLIVDGLVLDDWQAPVFIVDGYVDIQNVDAFLIGGDLVHQLGGSLTLRDVQADSIGNFLVQDVGEAIVRDIDINDAGDVFSTSVGMGTDFVSLDVLYLDVFTADKVFNLNTVANVDVNARELNLYDVNTAVRLEGSNIQMALENAEIGSPAGADAILVDQALLDLRDVRVVDAVNQALTITGGGNVTVVASLLSNANGVAIQANNGDLWADAVTVTSAIPGALVSSNGGSNLSFQSSLLYTGDTADTACKFTGTGGAVLNDCWVDVIAQITDSPCTGVASSMSVDQSTHAATMDLDWIVIQPAVRLAYGEFAR